MTGILTLTGVSCGSSLEVKIQEKEISQSAEELFVAQNFAPVNCTLWLTGKPFIYVGHELSITLTPTDGLPPESDYYQKLFTFKGISEETVLGNRFTASLLFECQGRSYRFATRYSLEELAANSYPPLLHNLIDREVIEHAHQVLADKEVYLLTSSWYDANNTPLRMRKFLPVIIRQVTIGNDLLPLRVRFSNDTDKEAYVYMSLNNNSSVTQYTSFASLFSFSNPRTPYPNTTQAHWDEIMNNRVAIGMAKEECRLAWGRPSEIRHLPSYQGLKEHWQYSSGNFLLFEEGLLTQFRQYPPPCNPNRTTTIRQRYASTPTLRHMPTFLPPHWPR